MPLCDLDKKGVQNALFFHVRVSSKCRSWCAEKIVVRGESRRSCERKAVEQVGGGVETLSPEAGR